MKQINFSALSKSNHLDSGIFGNKLLGFKLFDNFSTDDIKRYQNSQANGANKCRDLKFSIN